MNRSGLGRFAKMAALASVPAVLIFGLLTAASAQSPTQQTTQAATEASATGQATPGGATATPDLSVKTLVRLEVDPQPQPLKEDTQFEVRVLIDNVDHLSGFQFAISYDPKRVEPLKAVGASTTPAATPLVTSPGVPVVGRGVGDFLASSARAAGRFCSGPLRETDNTVMATCVTRDAPTCLGGPAGASGSGLLGAVTFKAKGEGPTTLTLAKTELVMDDVQPPCDPNDPNDFLPVSIPNRQQGVDLNLAQSGTSKTIIFVIVGVVAVAVIAAGGAGGYYLLKGRAPGPAA